MSLLLIGGFFGIEGVLLVVLVICLLLGHRF
jgi:hypothetical protein